MFQVHPWQAHSLQKFYSISKIRDEPSALNPDGRRVPVPLQVGTDPAEFKNHQLPLARIKKVCPTPCDAVLQPLSPKQIGRAHV